MMVPHVFKNQQRIISIVKSNYWIRKTKYGFTIPRNTEKAEAEDIKNGNTLWMDALRLEMKNIQIVFEEYDGDVKDLER